MYPGLCYGGPGADPEYEAGIHPGCDSSLLFTHSFTHSSDVEFSVFLECGRKPRNP